MTSQKEEMPENAGHETPLIDLSDAAVNQLIRSSKKRGYVTHGQINELLSVEDIKSEQIEDMLAKLNEIGINVVETKEADSDEEVAIQEDPDEEVDGDTELVEVRQRPAVQSGLKQSAEPTSDPVRIYLREMGSVELLSREGEIAIAKRIEAGREAMIAGLCESPLTFQAIIIWRDELNAGKMLLRDIIDLDATCAGPDAKALSAIDPASQLIAPPRGQLGQLPQMPLPATALLPAGERPDGRETAGDAMISESSPDDDDDMQNWLSVAAVEAELKPKVIESFDIVAATYKRLRRLQEQDIQFQLKRSSLSPAQERKYKKLKSEIVAEVKSLWLNRSAHRGAG
jgi:RNA polymerase primary sigma factor